MRYQRGLTLLEIMIAVTILIIVSTVAIPIYRGYVTEAEFGTAQKDFSQMQLILNDLALDNDLGALEPAGYTAGTDVNLYLNDSGFTLAAAAPAGTTAWNDPWGNVYRYQRSTTVTNPPTYSLRSAGPDGTYGNADDVVVTWP